MKTLTEQFTEILESHGVNPEHLRRKDHQTLTSIIFDLGEAVSEYNKQVVGEDCKLSLNPNSITNKYKQVVNEEHVEIRNRQKELL